MSDNFYFWVEVATLLVCALCYNRFNLSRYKLFLPYLAVIVLYEFGTIHKWFAIQRSNLWVVNIEITFEFLFYSYFIISAFNSSREKRAFIYLISAGLILTLIDVLVLQGPMALGTIAILVQYSLLISLVCRFFYTKMQDFGKHSSLLQQPDFWVNTGLLFFFLAEFMLFASFTNMASKKLYAYHLLFTVISNVAILILYSCLSISFICFRRMMKIS